VTATRAFDVVVAAGALVITLPVTLAAAIGILVTDGRPVIFAQQRVGLCGETFTMHKFRTMGGAPAGPGFDVGDTSRVTRLGQWLRVTKADELPQLVDVLRGEMSIVGPRPEVPSWVDAYAERFQRILTVRPGITDPAAIAFRHEEHILAASPDPEATYRDEILPRKLDLYDQYVDTRSLTGDITILIRTLLAIFTRSR